MQITTISSNVFATSISLKNLNYGQRSQRDSNQRPLDLKSRTLPPSCVDGSFTIILVTSGKYLMFCSHTVLQLVILPK